MNKQEKIAAFNPSYIGLTNAGIFGFPFTVEEADYVVIPIPWESTASFGNGTQDAPAMIYEASNQLDFYFPDFPDVWKKGIAMTDIDKTIKSHSIACRKIVEEHIALLESGAKSNAELVDKINAFGKACNEYVSSQVERYRSQKKQVILLGGDHSTSLGNIKSLAKNIAFGILQIDAHLDLRNAYEDLNYSHASVMYNALQEENVTGLVSVGIRDYCQEEVDFIDDQNGRVRLFSDQDNKEAMLKGSTWHSICEQIIAALPQQVYLTIDIDGLDPSLCPNTGTPVPGGLSYEQLIYLLKQLALSDKTIIGMDLVEVGNDAWDANVAARILYNMIGYWELNLR